MPKHDTMATPAEAMAPRCIGKIRSATAIDPNVARLLDTACAEQAKARAGATHHAGYPYEPTRLWLRGDIACVDNPRAAILKAPVWDETANRLVPQGCCLVEDKGDQQVKLTWRRGPNRFNALLSKTTYKRLLDIGTIAE